MRTPSSGKFGVVIDRNSRGGGAGCPISKCGSSSGVLSSENKGPDFGSQAQRIKAGKIFLKEGGTGTRRAARPRER